MYRLLQSRAIKNIEKIYDKITAGMRNTDKNLLNVNIYYYVIQLLDFFFLLISCKLQCAGAKLRLAKTSRARRGLVTGE